MLLKNGLAIKTNGRYYLPESIGLYQAEIVRNCPKFCFARRMSDDSQIFIPGKYSKGAVVGDMVFLSPLQQLGESEEGMVISIYISYLLREADLRELLHILLKILHGHSLRTVRGYYSVRVFKILLQVLYFQRIL